jgi:hypothetical protein
MMLVLLAAMSCSSDSTAIPEPAPTATQSTVGNEGGALNMLQLPNIADTVERVRPAVRRFRQWHRGRLRRIGTGINQ